jgi:YggT family protein
MSIAGLLITILNLFLWAVIISAVMSWLIAFEVINTHNKFVYMVYDFLTRVTQPLLNPIRRLLPNLGGIDISPIVLILLIYFLQSLIIEYAPLLKGTN